MSTEAARRYYEVIDDPGTTPADLAALYTGDAMLKSLREGMFRGKGGVREFYELNAEFFEAGAHHMNEFYVDGDTVICEGWIEGRTTAGRAYEGIGLVDVMDFDDGEIVAHRIYLDYSGIRSELPADADVPDYRE